MSEQSEPYDRLDNSEPSGPPEPARSAPKEEVKCVSFWKMPCVKDLLKRFRLVEVVPEKQRQKCESSLDFLEKELKMTHWVNWIKQLNLDEREQEYVAYTITKSQRYFEQGSKWKKSGDNIFAVQILAGALVPVLVGLIGTDGAVFDTIFRITAIMLSIGAALCRGTSTISLRWMPLRGVVG